MPSVVETLPERDRKWIIVLGCLSMAAFGIVLAVLGASLPILIARFGIGMTEAGGLLSLMSFAVLAASFVFGPIVDRYGYREMLLVAFALIVAGLEAMAFAPSIAVLRLSVLLVGFTGGLVNGGVNALIVEVSGQDRGAAVTFVGAFFGVGAAGLPFLLATLVGGGSFSHASILAVSGALVLLPLGVTAVTRLPESKQPRGFPVADARRLLRDPALLLMGAMLFLESGVETITGGFTPTFFVQELGVAPERAPLFLSVFWLGLLIARLGLSGILQRGSPLRVLFASITIAFVASVGLVSAGSVAVAATSVFFLGVGFAATFPVMYSVVGNRYAQLAGTALSLAIGMALTGGMVMPYVTGAVASANGMRASFLMVPAGLALLGTLLAVLSRRVAPNAFAADTYR